MFPSIPPLTDGILRHERDDPRAKMYLIPFSIRTALYVYRKRLAFTRIQTVVDDLLYTVFRTPYRGTAGINETTFDVDP